MRVNDLCDFIKERESVRIKKEAKKPWPWTSDAILSTYKFCNVRREDDKVTRWIAENWREPYKYEEHLWFAMVVARLFNLPNTLEHIGFPAPWKPEKLRKDLHAYRRQGNTVFNGAYIVSTNGHSMDKVEYLVLRVLGPLWAARKSIAPIKGDTLRGFHQRLTRYDGLGSFMAAQVVADMKYVEPLAEADDWFTFAAPGPGSKRGLNRVCDRPADATWPGGTWHEAVHKLHVAVNDRLKWKPRLHAQDLQNCLCEFDKYERARTAQGKPKQLYKPKV